MQILQAEHVDGEAVLNISWKGENGDLPQPIVYDASEADIRRWAAEAVRAGLPGISPDPNVNFQDFIVERVAAKDGLPNRVLLRGKTEFGALFA